MARVQHTNELSHIKKDDAAVFNKFSFVFRLLINSSANIV